MSLNVKVGLIGALDMLKFKNMAKVREQMIDAAPANEINGDFQININAKTLHPDFQELVIDQVIDHGKAGAKTIIMKRADGSPCAYFRAGQYISLKTKIGDSFVTRPYSISCSPKRASEGSISVTIRSNPGGFAAEHYLAEFKPGDKVIGSDGQGQFYYEPIRDAAKVVAVAGGSGITPFLSMASAIRDGIEDFELTILSGNKTEETILFKDELDAIAAATDKVKVVHVLSDEEKEGYEHGFITAELIKKYGGDGDYSVFVCGPEPMYRFLDGELPKLGLPKRRIRKEMLGVTKHVSEKPGYPAEAVGQTFKLTIRQGTLEIVVDAAANEPVLTAIERAGVKAPSRCRSGECGWCRSKLVSGEVFVPAENEGRRYADIKHNYIHPCSSFPVSDLIVEVPGEYFPETE